MENKQHLPILVYYNFRGLLQPIRNLLCYLDISFFEIYIEEFEAQKKAFDSSLLRVLGGAKVDKAQLPALIHRGETIYEVLPIMTYLCYACQRQDLLGSSLQKRARVQEIMEIYNSHHVQTMSGVLALPEYVLTRPQPFVDAHLHALYQQIVGRQGYVREICDHIRAHPSHRYILGELTIIDFIFLESCIYLVGCFNKLDRVSPQQGAALTSKGALLLEDPPFEYLRVMRSYQETIMKQPFYLKHQKYLESFSLISKFTSQQRVAGFKKMWHGNPWLVR